MQQNWGFLQQPRVKLLPLRGTASRSNLLHRPNSAYYKTFLSFLIRNPDIGISVFDLQNPGYMFELGGISSCPVPVAQQKEADVSPKAWIFPCQTPLLVLLIQSTSQPAWPTGRAWDSKQNMDPGNSWGQRWAKSCLLDWSVHQIRNKH